MISLLNKIKNWLFGDKPVDMLVREAVENLELIKSKGIKSMIEIELGVMQND